MRIILAAVAALTIAASAGTAQAGCQINVGVRNTGTSEITVSNGSQVKSRGGFWRRLRKGMWAYSTGGSFKLGPGETFSDGYIATFGCGKRRYRFIVQCVNPATGSMVEQYHYYPSTSGWTERQTFTKSLSCL